MNKKVGELFLETMSQIIQNEDYSSKEKTKALFNLLNALLEEITLTEKLVFTTLFSRAAFIGNKYSVDSKLMYYLHTFRRDNERMKITDDSEIYVALGSYIIEQMVYFIFYGKKESIHLPNHLLDQFGAQEKEVIKFKPVVEVIIDSIDLDNHSLNFYDEKDASILRIAVFDKADINEIFNDNLKSLKNTFPLPVHANFIDVEILSDGTYLPHGLVVEPDYLIDVTAVANCFKDYGTESLLRIISKFGKVDNSIPLIVGNIANMFLDEIVSNPDIKFNELLPKIFKMDPLGLSNCSDEQVGDLINGAKMHYLNLKKAIASDLPSRGIHRDQIFLEPSFYSRDFGLQGRLDLFHHVPEKNQYDIIELKSGSPYRANVYGLSSSHYTQTLLYDLIVKSTFGFHIKPNNYILYSKLPTNPLKYAPPVKSQQYEALKIRNELIAIEYKMANSPEDAAGIFSYLKLSNFPKTKGYEMRDLDQFEKSYTSLTNFEKLYFDAYSSFICREHRMAKTGEHGINKSNGLSALWLENNDEKEDRFSVVTDLKIIGNHSKEDLPFLVLQRDWITSSLANFRVGDIAVLYPKGGNSRAILKNQIFKCSILNIDRDQIEVRLRSKQYNDRLFRETQEWTIEPDSLDSGFNTLYRSLYEFIGSKKQVRDLWLGIQPPRQLEKSEYKIVPGLTEEQQVLLNKMFNIKDYFLLWGPPGTGKTSIMLKSLVQRVFQETEETILLLAYTNRAVDEICAAIESIEPNFSEHYIRLGSGTGCASEYKHRLINELISDFTNREEIRNLILNKRIFVSTVSSVVSQNDLFKMKKFDRIIIDEASQILEPMLVGLLTRARKTVLIGDHKQLPAVVIQRAEYSLLKHKDLLDLNITDMRMSLFERLYHRCKQMDWNHALGILSYQGRMHEDLMTFPNKYFYEQNLKVLPGIVRLQSETLGTQKGKHDLENHRFIYVPTDLDLNFNWKTNVFEAEKVISILKLLMKFSKDQKKEIDKNSIGIITPYRAQIAIIRRMVEKEFEYLLDYITIDTVERFQGGARDIIILSLCTNKFSQLSSLVSLSKEGVDRKLNVAMTRAREQLIVIGNKKILKLNDTYRALIEEAHEWQG